MYSEFGIVLQDEVYQGRKVICGGSKKEAKEAP
jgi:hypothetical protein